MLYLVSLLRAYVVALRLENCAGLWEETLHLIWLPFELTSEVSTSFIFGCPGLLGQPYLTCTMRCLGPENFKFFLPLKFSLHSSVM